MTTMTGKVIFVSCLAGMLMVTQYSRAGNTAFTCKKNTDMQTDSQKLVRYIAIVNEGGQKKVYGDKEPYQSKQQPSGNAAFGVSEKDPTANLFDPTCYLVIRDEYNNIRRYKTVADVPPNDIERIKVLKSNAAKLLNGQQTDSESNSFGTGATTSADIPLQRSANAVRKLVQQLESEKLIAAGAVFKISAENTRVVLDDKKLEGAGIEKLVTQLQQLKITSLERDKMGNISYQ